MRKKLILILFITMAAQTLLSGCGKISEKPQDAAVSAQPEEAAEETIGGHNRTVTLDTKVQELEEGFSAIRYEGKDGFDEFLAEGGASSDMDVVDFLTEHLVSDLPDLVLGGKPFGCSTLSVKSSGEGYLFGRNFDWNKCNAMVVGSYPENGYASVSTVNTDFIQTGGMDLSKLPDTVAAVIGLYAPLDGMNEKGLAVSVNMIEDSDTIEQDTEKPDLTTTTAIRLLLNEAATVDEALKLLNQHDLHASMGMMVHFAIADADGRSVVVEYVDNGMVVTDTPVVTNFYIAAGEKYGIGSSQSHTRYDILNQALKEQETMDMPNVRDALNSVSKDNFDEFESTEWSIVMNQETKEMTYYHRENYGNGYTFQI